MNLWITGITLGLLGAACWTDFRRMVIPNLLTGCFAGAGLIYQTAFGGWPGTAAALTGGAAGLLPLLLLYRLKGIGAGDVKWFAAFGMWAGMLPVLRLIMYSILAAGVFSVLLLLCSLPGIRIWASKMPWPWGPHPAKAGRKAHFPFMLAVLPGYAWMWLNLGGEWQ